MKQFKSLRQDRSLDDADAGDVASRPFDAGEASSTPASSNSVSRIKLLSEPGAEKPTAWPCRSVILATGPPTLANQKMSGAPVASGEMILSGAPGTQAPRMSANPAPTAMSTFPDPSTLSSAA